jgi:hypothetical protein
MSVRHRFRQPFTIAAAALLAACADKSVLAPDPERAPQAVPKAPAASVEVNTAIAELRRVTAKYHDVAVAVADGFSPVFTSCEEREGEVPIAIPYAHLDRLLDGVLDPSLPDALLYEPGKDGTLKLVGVEMVLPYPFWTAAEPPRFLGVPLQREDELGVFGLHIWIWRHSPNGMFSIDNPRVSCDAVS